MIVVWGALDDDPVAAVLEALGDVDDHAPGGAVVHLDADAVARLEYDLELGAAVTGWFAVGGRRVALEEIAGWYVRPGPGRSPAASALLTAATGARATVAVVNRPPAGASNHAKPYQALQIGATGMAVPDTLVTSDRQAAHHFLRRHGRVVVKSISGVRSIVAEVDDPALERVGHGPVQLQRHVDGLDVRVHVVGHQCFATAIVSEATDYRYGDVDMSPFTLPVDLRERLVHLTQRMGLLLAGIDLRRATDGRWWCFEVNPSPGFTYYEAHTGQPITAAVAALLRSGSPTPARGRAGTGRGVAA